VAKAVLFLDSRGKVIAFFAGVFGKKAVVASTKDNRNSRSILLIGKTWHLWDRM
jgi:hypothetical protein